MADLIRHDVLLPVYYTGRQTFGFAMPGIESELGVNKATLGWINAVLLWTYAIGQAVNGNLGDKFGGRTMMSMGAVLSCSLNWGMSFAQAVGGLMTAWPSTALRNRWAGR